MSLPEGPQSTFSYRRHSTWYFGIPWAVTYMEEVLRKEAASTTDGMSTPELQLRQDAIEECAQPDELIELDSPALFEWARESIGAIINKDPCGFTFSPKCEDPLVKESETIKVLVLRKKIAKTEEDLATSDDLHYKSPPTDAQVEKLRSKGFTVEWYKVVEELIARNGFL